MGNKPLVLPYFTDHSNFMNKLMVHDDLPLKRDF
jgi:hypothetical protein